MFSHIMTTAGNAPTPTGLLGDYSMLIMMLIVFVLFYFMMIRPESKKKKEQEALRNSVRKGDKITTIGGINGKVVDVKDDRIVLETGEDQVRIEFQKWAIMTNNTAEKDKSNRVAEAKEAARKAKEEKARGNTA